MCSPKKGHVCAGENDVCRNACCGLHHSNKLRKRNDSMAKYVVKRTILAIITVILISAIHIFLQCTPFQAARLTAKKRCRPRFRRHWKKRYGLNEPVPVQYVNYMRRLVTELDFGVGLKTGRDVSTTIMTGMNVSAKLGLSAAAVAIVFGLVLGSVAALNRESSSTAWSCFLNACDLGPEFCFWQRCFCLCSPFSSAGCRRGPPRIQTMFCRLFRSLCIRWRISRV